MRPQLPEAEPDVASVLVAGLSGLHPADTIGYALFTIDCEHGVHLTTGACCAYHAMQELLRVWKSELSVLVPCSDGPG